MGGAEGQVIDLAFRHFQVGSAPVDVQRHTARIGSTQLRCDAAVPGTGRTGALALTVGAWLDAWAGLAAGAATVLTDRLAFPRAVGDGGAFRAVPPPTGDPAPVSPA
jgi:hypothetical protein